MRRRQPPDEPSIAMLVLSLAAIALGVLPWLESKHRHPARQDHGPRTEVRLDVAVPADLEDSVQAARRLLRRDPDAALAHIETALARADGAPAALRAELWTWAAEVHARRWHLHRAREALRAAIDALPTRERREALADVEEQIQRGQPERGQASSYHAARDAGPAATLAGITPEIAKRAQFARGKGCNYCGKKGFRGRLGIYELMLVTAKIRELIFQNASSQELRALAVQQGMRTLYLDGVEKVMRGITTLEEVYRVAKKTESDVVVPI